MGSCPNGHRSPWEGDPSWKIGLGAMCSHAQISHGCLWLSGILAERIRGDAQVYSVFAAPTPETILCRLLAQLQASEHDKFAAHLYRSRREYRSACKRAGKSGKPIERYVISTFQIAESMGFKGELRQWEYLLRIGN